MIRTLIPELLLKLDRIYNRYTSFPRGRGAFVRMFCWGVRNWGFKPPVFRLRSGIVFEYSPVAATDVVIRELLIHDVLEPQQTELIKDLLPENGIFLDVGANIGYFSIVAAKMLGVGGHVFAFEPVDATYRVLCKNIELNGLNNFVTPINLACFSAPGEMAMTQSEEPSKSYLSYSETANTEKVSMTTLDDFVEQRGISVVDCIKIDAEGSDFEIIRGARRTIERCRPAVILETDHLGRFGSSKLDVSRFFESIDYSISEIKCDHSTDLLCLPGKSAIRRRASVAAESKGFKSQGRPAAN
jgi:FkbM family methyltransferase